MEAKFNFFQQWYPVSPIEDLALEQPTPVTLLGQEIAIKAKFPN
ncbi:hypothetical protein [Tolypothrix sp. FACHB-123]|nr:hypothetical protein [Tolypothrix sp. FACHB-123]